MKRQLGLAVGLVLIAGAGLRADRLQSESHIRLRQLRIVGKQGWLDGICLLRREYYQFWYTKDVPIDFDAASRGVAVEWTAQVKSSEFVQRGRSEEAGFNVYLTDRKRHTFTVFLAEDRVILRNNWDVDSPGDLATYHIDTTDRFHHYRLVVHDDVGMLFIDGKAEPVLTLKVGKIIKQAPANDLTIGDRGVHTGCAVSIKSFFIAGDARTKSPLPARGAAKRL